MPRVRRALRMVRAGDLVQRLGRGPARGGRTTLPPATWANTVGPALAQVTALVGLRREDGTLRCVAANEAALHELLAREAHVLAAWNAVAGARGGPRAQRVEAWVAAGFRSQRVPSSPHQPPRPPAPPTAEPPSTDDEALGRHWRQAAQEAEGVSDPALREALTRLRARALAR